MTSRVRSPEEDQARASCRGIVHRHGSSLRKEGRNKIVVAPCEAWPLGIVTAYNGWVDLHRRLEICRADPSVVIDGMFIHEEATCC